MVLLLEEIGTTIDSWTKVGDPRVAVDAIVSGINPGLYPAGRYVVPVGKILRLHALTASLSTSQIENSGTVNPIRQGVAKFEVNGSAALEASMQKTQIDLQGSIEGAFGGASFHNAGIRRAVDMDGVELAAGETARILFSPTALAGTSICPMRITGAIYSTDLSGGAVRVVQSALIPYDSTADQEVAILTAPAGGSRLCSMAVDLLSTYKNLYVQIRLGGFLIYEAAMIRSEQKSSPWMMTLPSEGLTLPAGAQIELSAGAAFPANQQVGLQISGELVNAVGVQGAAWVS